MSSEGNDGSQRPAAVRVLTLISSLAAGGAETVTVAFTRALAARQGTATLATLTDRHDGHLAARLRAPGVERLDLGGRRLADPWLLLRLVALLRRRRFDLLHVHGQDASILGAAAAPLAGTPLVLTRHVLAEPATTRRELWRARLAWGAARRAKRVVAVSEEVAATLLRAGVKPTRIEVVHNGIEIPPPESPGDGQEVEAIRQRLGAKGDDPVVLVAAALRLPKGHRILFESLPKLLQELPALRVWLAGGGELEAQVRGWAAPYGERVAVLGWRADVRALMTASDLVVLPSLSEGLPTVLMEAAAAARPVVATDVGGTARVVSDGRTGILVPAGDADALGLAVRRLLLDPGLRRSLGQAARARAVARFGIERQLTDTLSLWQGVRREG